MTGVVGSGTRREATDRGRRGERTNRSARERKAVTGERGEIHTMGRTPGRPKNKHNPPPLRAWMRYGRVKGVDTTYHLRRHHLRAAVREVHNVHLALVLSLGRQLGGGLHRKERDFDVGHRDLPPHAPDAARAQHQRGKEDEEAEEEEEENRKWKRRRRRRKRESVKRGEEEGWTA